MGSFPPANCGIQSIACFHWSFLDQCVQCISFYSFCGAVAFIFDTSLHINKWEAKIKPNDTPVPSVKCENNKEKNESERGVKLGIKIKRGYKKLNRKGKTLDEKSKPCTCSTTLLWVSRHRPRSVLESFAVGGWYVILKWTFKINNTCTFCILT